MYDRIVRVFSMNINEAVQLSSASPVFRTKLGRESHRIGRISFKIQPPNHPTDSVVHGVSAMRAKGIGMKFSFFTRLSILLVGMMHFGSSKWRQSTYLKCTNISESFLFYLSVLVFLPVIRCIYLPSMCIWDQRISTNLCNKCDQNIVSSMLVFCEYMCVLLLLQSEYSKKLAFAYFTTHSAVVCEYTESLPHRLTRDTCAIGVNNQRD